MKCFRGHEKKLQFISIMRYWTSQYNVYEKEEKKIIKDAKTLKIKIILNLTVKL
jgi:hypothetical protein